MKTKAQIVQRLLEDKQIDAEEAVILLMQDKEVQFIPHNPLPAWPVYPTYPSPIWDSRPELTSNISNARNNMPSIKSCSWIMDNDEPCGEMCEGRTTMCASHNRQLRREATEEKKQSQKRNTQIAKRPNRKRKGNEHLKEIINLYETGMGLRAISRKLQIPLSNVDTIIKTNKHLITRDYVLPSIKQRFESYVFPEPNTGCWIWTGTVNNHGYGTLKHKDDKLGSTLAHRMSYQFHKGEIPKGLLVLHSCDNPYCVNPDHLFIGTHKDNSQDMVSKGRHPNQGKIRPFSKKRIKINKRYFKLVEQFKKDNPLCKANVNEYCTEKTDDPHHTRGRGEFLLEVHTWLPVCRSCHSYIEAHPKEAKERGWSESRLATIKPTI